MIMTDQTKNSATPPSRLRAWGLLVAGLLCLWTFAVFIGPWVQDSIPIFREIVQVIEDRDIDAGAYFYSDTKESYEAEYYLLETMRFRAPAGVGFTLPFIGSIILCVVILWIGYRYIPTD
jgi:hypothetical protein